MCFGHIISTPLTQSQIFYNSLSTHLHVLSATLSKKETATATMKIKVNKQNWLKKKKKQAKHRFYFILARYS